MLRIALLLMACFLIFLGMREFLGGKRGSKGVAIALLLGAGALAIAALVLPMLLSS